MSPKKYEVLTLNKTTGLEGELTPIPPAGPNQFAEYGRSIRRYVPQVTVPLPPVGAPHFPFASQHSTMQGITIS